MSEHAQGSELEVEREARRILPTLVSGRLERRGRDYIVTVRGTTRTARGRGRLSAAMARRFAARGWITPAEDGIYHLAPDGAAWLRRVEAELLTRFRDQHGEIEGLTSGLRREQAGTPLDALKRLACNGLPFLSADEREAAERLQRDFELAQLRPRLTRDLEGVLVRSPGAAVDPGGARVTALAAKPRCLDALDAVGPGLADLLIETLLMARGLNEAERGFGWPARSAKTVLRLALSRLATHYGLASGGRKPGRIEAWRLQEGATS